MARRLASAIGFVLVLSALVLGAPSAESQEPSRLRIAIKGYENNITPFTITFGALPATNDVVHLVYDSLFWSQVRAEPEPWLAESAEPNADNTQWTVRLREGVIWHDGTPFTAEDVKFSFEYYLLQEGASGRYAHHVSDVPVFTSAEVVDPLTVRLVFGSPAPQFEIMPGADLPILPKHIWETVTDPKTFTAQPPVGTGPYKVVEMVTDQRYGLEANDDYFLGRPLVDELELVVIPDPSAAFAALQTGDVDMVERIVPPELVDQFEGSAEVAIAEGTRLESTQLYFNARKAPLDDPDLRKAISMGIDLDALVETVLLGNGRPGRDSFVHPDSPWAIPDGGHEFDPDGARALLDQAGYDQEGADGLRLAPDGTSLEFSVLVSSFEPLDIRGVQLMAEQLSSIGVRLNVEPLEPVALRQRRQAPPGEIPAYDLYVSGLEAHAHVDPDSLYYFFHSPGDKGFGASITGFTNAEFDALAEAAAVAEADERLELFADMQQILADEAPVIVMWYPDGLYGYRPSAYDGWITDPGQGIFTVRSFLADYAATGGEGDEAGAGDTEGQRAGADADEGDDAGSGSTFALVIAAAAVAAVAAVIVVRRRRALEDLEE